MSEILSSALAGLKDRPDLADAIYQWRPDGVRFAADEILPVVPVDTQAGSVEVVTTESLLNVPNTARAAGGYYNEINEYLTTIAYSCTDKGLENADLHGYKQTLQYNREVGKVQHILWQMMLAREKTVMDRVLNATTWSGMITTPPQVTAAHKNWSDPKNSDPIADVMTAKAAVLGRTGVEPNAVIMSAKTLGSLLVHEKILAKFQNNSVVTNQLIQDSLKLIFDVEKIIVSDVMYNVAAEGLTASLSSVASDTYVSVARVGGAGGISTPAIGWTFLWNEDSPNPYTVESYSDMRRRATIYRVRHNTDEKIVEPKFAQLIKVDGHK